MLSNKPTLPYHFVPNFQQETESDRVMTLSLVIIEPLSQLTYDLMMCSFARCGRPTFSWKKQNGLNKFISPK